MEEIVQRIKFARKKLGLTQEEFGKTIGLKRAALSVIEIGKTSLTEQNIMLICMKFNINEDWLRTGKGEMFIQPDDIETEVVKIFRNLTPEGRAEVLNFIEYILKKQNSDEQSKNVVG